MTSILLLEEDDELIRRSRQMARTNIVETPEPPAPPAFVSAEIGNVNSTTVVVTFNQTLTSAPSLSIFADTVEQTIDSSSFVGVTASYVLTGTYTSEDVFMLNYLSVEYSVTNNIPAGLTLPQVASATLLLDLEADMLLLSDGDPVSTWADQSGNGYDFTQTGDARPTKQTIGSYPTVVFDGIGNWMLGQNWAALDNLPSFAVFAVIDENAAGDIFSKIGNNLCSDVGSQGWVVFQQGAGLSMDTSNYVYQNWNNPATPSNPFVACFEVVNFQELHSYMNNALNDAFGIGGGGTVGTVTNISNSEPVRIGIDGAEGNCDGWASMNLSAALLYQITDPANWATDRAAITTWLAARYGITL